MTNHESKFQNLIQLCAEEKSSGATAVLIHHPRVLGDNYEELVENLNRIADAELQILILPCAKRGAQDDSIAC